MRHERYLDLLELEGERLAATPVDALDAPVPAVDGWTVEDVLRHTARVHRWVTGALQAEPGTDVWNTRAADLPPAPGGAACITAYHEALHGLLAELRRHDLDEAVPVFVGHGSVAFWSRRQANEASVHRVDVADAIHAAGGPAPLPIDADLAADGIDEWARLFVAVRWPQRYGALPEALHGRSIHIHGTDDPAPADGAEWLITFPDGATVVEATHAKGDVALRGPVNDLLLTLWRRRPLDTIDVIGDRELAELVFDTFQI